jgi:hypothetical protein
MGGRLARNVYVDGAGWGPAFGNEGDVPDAVASKVTNPFAWEGGTAPGAVPSPQAPGTVGRPAGNASKDEWVAYAVAQGMGRDEAERHSRADLRALYPEEG